MGSSVLLRALSSLSLITYVALALSWSKPGCPEECGNVNITYPFGIGSECSANSFFRITCQNSTNPPTPFLSSINLEALSIPAPGIIIVKQPVSPMNCSDVEITESVATSLRGSPFNISARYNTMAVLGCQISVWLRRHNRTAKVGGCMAICDDNSTDNSCLGLNCCQARVPSGLQELRYTYESLRASTNNNSFCGYAFPVERKWLQEDYKKYKGLHKNPLNPYDKEFTSAPLVLEWEINNLESSDSIACGYSTEYVGPPFGFHEDRYISSSNSCACLNGFEGNPYLPGGCTDIDECMMFATSQFNEFCVDGTCINTKGGYTCRQPLHLDYYFRDENNRSSVKIAFISIASVLGGLILSVGVWKWARAIRKRIKASRKRKFFKRNGGLLLEQQLSATENGLEKTKLFSSKELAQATDHYNENRVLGRGGQGTVYKGMLADGRIVAVKRSKRVDEGDLEVFINEVVILSQINHRNVVKLLGCCLETEVPLLVYEFIPNGTLFQHIHEPNEDFQLSWEMRLRIAREIAGALAYLHSAASAPIYHRDIKSTNILLDDKYRAKVSDFGTSRSVAIDQTHLTTRVLGTFGYLDPEYFQSSQFTEKSDVYSFGVVMVELLTGEKAISSIRVELGRSLATHFLHSMEENQLFDILDATVVKEGKREEIVAIAEIARRCLHLNGKRRPTMKEVAVELEGIQILKEGPFFQQNGDDSRDWNYIEVDES